MLFPPMERRIFLAGALGGFYAWASARTGQPLFAAPATGKVKRCLVLWMSGGPSQMETFDPKPGTNTGGPTLAIPTSVPGIQIAAGFPQIAQRMQHLAIVRNLTSKEGDHDRGTYTMHTGYSPVPAFPRPALGSAVSALLEAQDMPKYIALGKQGLGPAWLGPEHAPFSISSPEEGRQLLVQLRAKRHRLDLIQKLGQSFQQSHGNDTVALRSSLVDRIARVAATPMAEALDWSVEADAVKQRYGDTQFGQLCLTARRLLERGATFVEVEHGGWDTHSDNFASTTRLANEVDVPWASLLDDLQQSGLLQETLVVWMGEFGRTPVINTSNGRDHFPDVTPVVLCGGGIQGGQVVGQTTADGQKIDGPSTSIADLMATIVASMGLDPDHEFTTDFGSPAQLTEEGKALKQLLV